MGPAIYRRIVLGTTRQLPTAASARKLVAGIVMEINHRDIRSKAHHLTVKELVAHYRHRELSQREKDAL